MIGGAWTLSASTRLWCQACQVELAQQLVCLASRSDAISNQDCQSLAQATWLQKLRLRNYPCRESELWVFKNIGEVKGPFGSCVALVGV